MKFSFLFFIFSVQLIVAQSELLTINDSSYSLEAFENSQSTNLKGLGVDKALNLFTEFELLKQYALKNGAEKDHDFLKKYYEKLYELRENQLIPAKTLDSALASYAKRIQTEFKVQVLYANQKNKAEVQEAIRNGRDFTDLIGQYSEDTSYQKPTYIPFGQILNDEYLELLENLPIGKISIPLFISEDYVMWIKMIEKRDALGLQRFQRFAHSDKNTVDSIRTLVVEKDESFTPLVEKYSEKGKATKGLIKDHINGTPDEVYEAVKNLEVGEYSKVFLYEGKYNLYRLLRRVPFKTNEERRLVLLPMYKETPEYFSIYDKNLQLIDTVKTYKLEVKNIDETVSNASTWFRDSLQYSRYQKPLFTLAGDTVRQVDMLKYLRKLGLQTLSSQEMGSAIGDELYSRKRKYFDNVLFYQLPKIAPQVQKIKSSALIDYAFDLILQKSYQDEKGMEEYIRANPKRFNLPARAEMVNYYCVNENVGKEVLKMVKKKNTQKEIVDSYKVKLDANSQPFVYAQQGKVSEFSSEYPKGVPFQKGAYLTSLDNGKYLVTQIKAIIPPQLMTVEEAKLKLLDEYQSVYYKNTLDKLKSDADITINAEELERLKKKYK